MLMKDVHKFVLLSLLIIMLSFAALAYAGGEPTHEEVAAAEREYTYTTAENVAAGKRAAERFWLSNYEIDEVAAAEREFTYTTAAAVERGRVAAQSLSQAREAGVVEMERYRETMSGEREFTYTTAEAVEKGRLAAAAYWQAWEEEVLSR